MVAGSIFYELHSSAPPLKTRGGAPGGGDESKARSEIWVERSSRETSLRNRDHGPTPKDVGWGTRKAKTVPARSVDRSDSNGALSSFLIEQVAAPTPLAWNFHQSSFDRIPVHVIEFLGSLFSAVDVKVVESLQPKRLKFLSGRSSSANKLRDAVALSGVSQFARHSFLQYLQDRGERFLGWLTKEQVDMFGHYNVPDDEKLVTLPKPFQHV